MMISPCEYAEKLKTDSLKELIEERDELIEFIRAFEGSCIDFTSKELDLDHDAAFIDPACKLAQFAEDAYPGAYAKHIDPAPDVRYQIYLEYLAKVSLALYEKFSEEYE